MVPGVEEPDGMGGNEFECEREGECVGTDALRWRCSGGGRKVLYIGMRGGVACGRVGGPLLFVGSLVGLTLYGADLWVHSSDCRRERTYRQIEAEQ